MPIRPKIVTEFRVPMEMGQEFRRLLPLPQFRGSPVVPPARVSKLPRHRVGAPSGELQAPELLHIGGERLDGQPRGINRLAQLLVPPPPLGWRKGKGPGSAPEASSQTHLLDGFSAHQEKFIKPGNRFH